MRSSYSDNQTISNNAIVVIAFSTSRQAKHCHVTLTALFSKIKKRVDSLYNRQNGQAVLEDIAQIYSSYGFSNSNGWEQEQPIYLSGNEVAWLLPFGIKRSEVEDLLATMEPRSIDFHDMQHAPEWMSFPIPEAMLFPEDFEDMDYLETEKEYPGNPPKRVIH